MTLMETNKVALLGRNAFVAARREIDKDVVIIRGLSGGFFITLHVVAFARTILIRLNKSSRLDKSLSTSKGESLTLNSRQSMQ